MAPVSTPRDSPSTAAAAPFLRTMRALEAAVHLTSDFRTMSRPIANGISSHPVVVVAS